MNKKPSLKRITSFLVVLCMMCGFAVPLASVTASAAAPTSYTTITADSTASVSITSSGSAKYFKFVPTQSGTYKFYSTNYSADPKASLLDASGNTLTTNDDGNSSNYNFSITYSCTANTTYYIKAYLYSSSSTGSYTLNVVTVSVDSTPTPAPTGEVVNINAAGGTNYPLFNSGNSTSNGWDDYCEINPAPNTYTNNGYDLFGDIESTSTSRFILGLSFNINIDILEQTKLQVKAWDVDESVAYCGSGYEYDYIYLVDETEPSATIVLDGHMSGQDDTWNNTEFIIEPSLLQKGHTYHLELQMTCTGSHTCSYYAVIVRTVNLIVNGASEPSVDPTTGIENADLDASISSSGLVSVDLTANAYTPENYTLEYKAVCSADSAQYGGKECSATFSTTSGGFDATFQLESGAPRGTYEITVFIKNSAGTVIATRTATVSYGYSAVSYNANGGSQNLPTDGTTYSSGDTVTVKFDYVPSLYGYTFLGWSTQRNATVPMYTKNGTKTFTIGSSDVTLYAVWALDGCEHEWSETSRTDATCTTPGLIVNTCSLCGDTQDSTIPALDHAYDNACDTSCNTCSHTRTVTHSYKTTWDKNSSQHWHQCSVCGDKKDVAGHVYDNACDTTCNTCGYTRTITHSYKTTWDKNTTQHWHECSVCGDKKDAVDHVYDNACDTTCNTCGYVRTITHSFKTAWESDKDGHWHECSVCGASDEKKQHTSGAEATEDTAQTCTTCGYVIKAALGHTHEYGDAWESNATKHWHSCRCGAKSDEADHVFDDEQDSECNTCGYTRQVQTTPSETTTPDGTTTPDTTNSEKGSGNKSNDNTTTVIIIVVASVAVIGVGTAVTFTLKKKK